jgi:hypothetical protein
LGRAELSDGPAQAVIQVEVGNKGKREKERGEGPGAGPMCMGQRGHARSGRAHLPPATTIAYRENWRRRAVQGLPAGGGGRWRGLGRVAARWGGAGTGLVPSSRPAAATSGGGTGGSFAGVSLGQTSTPAAIGRPKQIRRGTLGRE